MSMPAALALTASVTDLPAIMRAISATRASAVSRSTSVTVRLARTCFEIR